MRRAAILIALAAQACGSPCDYEVHDVCVYAVDEAPDQDLTAAALEFYATRWAQSHGLRMRESMEILGQLTSLSWTPRPQESRFQALYWPDSLSIEVPVHPKTMWFSLFHEITHHYHHLEHLDPDAPDCYGNQDNYPDLGFICIQPADVQADCRPDTHVWIIGITLLWQEEISRPGASPPPGHYLAQTPDPSAQPDT
jgi:hypothetical protein